MNPLEHFLTSFFELKYKIADFIFCFMMGVSVIYLGVKFVTDKIEFELDRLSKKYYKFRQRNDKIK